MKAKHKSSQSEIPTEFGSSDMHQVKCLQENTMLRKRGSEGAASYDLSATYNCAIPTQRKGIVQMGLPITLPLGTFAMIAPRLGLAFTKFIDVA